MCLGITRDVMTMRSAGTPLATIRRTIDARYRGEATPTPYPKD